MWNEKRQSHSRNRIQPESRFTSRAPFRRVLTSPPKTKMTKSRKLIPAGWRGCATSLLASRSGSPALYCRCIFHCAVRCSFVTGNRFSYVTTRLRIQIAHSSSSSLRLAGSLFTSRDRPRAAERLDRRVLPHFHHGKVTVLTIEHVPVVRHSYAINSNWVCTYWSASL